MQGFPATAQIYIGDLCDAASMSVNVTIAAANACTATTLSVSGLGEVDGSVKLNYDPTTKTYTGTAFALDKTCGKGAISFPLKNVNGECIDVDLSGVGPLKTVLGGKSIKGKITSKAAVGKRRRRRETAAVTSGAENSTSALEEVVNVANDALKNATKALANETAVNGPGNSTFGNNITSGKLANAANDALKAVNNQTANATTNANETLSNITSQEAFANVKNDAMAKANESDTIANASEAINDDDDAANTIILSAMAAIGAVMSYLL
eukprot:Awhi_evm1s12425